MTRSAKVTSLDSLREMRTALAAFAADSQDAVTALVLEVRRAVDWLEQDRRQYWPEQIRQASNRCIEARNALERCQLKYGSEEAPACYEQKKAWEKARRRLRFCEERLQATKRWIRKVREEVEEFNGQVAQMNTYLDGDIPLAVAALERMIRALDRYVASPAAHDTPLEPPPEREESSEVVDPQRGDAHENL